MNIYTLTKTELAERGLALAIQFLNKNGMAHPQVVKLMSMAPFLASSPKGSYGCGMYSPNSRTIIVSEQDCARVSPGQPMQWSFPGYTVDRTPMGVMAHEHGHYVDHARGYPSDRKEWKALRSERISNYEPNSSEAFAESFRVFLLNPALLKVVAPGRYGFLTAGLCLKPVFTSKDPLAVLVKRGATDKIIAAATSKIAKHLKINARSAV